MRIKTKHPLNCKIRPCTSGMSKLINLGIIQYMQPLDPKVSFRV